MSAAAISIAAYGIYLLGQGLAMLIAPNVVLPILGMPQALDVWVRIVGMTLVFFSLYYFLAARLEYRAFFALTVVTRVAVPFVFAALIATGQGPQGLLLFTPADLLFALWTALALRRPAPMAAVSAG